MAPVVLERELDIIVEPRWRCRAQIIFLCLVKARILQAGTESGGQLPQDTHVAGKRIEMLDVESGCISCVVPVQHAGIEVPAGIQLPGESRVSLVQLHNPQKNAAV